MNVVVIAHQDPLDHVLAPVEYDPIGQSGADLPVIAAQLG